MVGDPRRSTASWMFLGLLPLTALTTWYWVRQLCPSNRATRRSFGAVPTASSQAITGFPSGASTTCTSPKDGAVPDTDGPTACQLVPAQTRRSIVERVPETVLNGTTGR